MPSLQSLEQRYRDKPFKVLLVNVREQSEEVRHLFEKMQIALPVALDQDGEVSRSYHVSNHPVKFLIDGRGNLIAMGFGYRNWDSEEINKLVNVLLQKAGELPKI